MNSSRMHRTLLILAPLLLPFLAPAQTDNYVLKGKIGSLNSPAKIFLTYNIAGAQKTDSTVIQNGSFEFKGQLNDPFSATLILDKEGRGFGALDFRSRQQDLKHIYLEKGTILLSATDSVSKATVSGSKLNNDNEKLKAALKPLEKKMMGLNTDWQNASEERKVSEEFKTSLQDRYEAIQEEQKAIFKKFILENPHSYVSLDVLGAIAGPNPEYNEVGPLYAALSPKLKATQRGKMLGKMLDSGKNTSIGAIAPDFTQNDVNGKPVKLSDFRGKYVLLDFWASWCGPCRQENPHVVNVYNKFKDKNFTILGVSLDRTNGKDAWLKAIADDKLTWTNVSDLKFWKNEVAVQYGVQSIPQNFLLDPQGKIIAKNLRGEDLERKLSELIK